VALDGVDAINQAVTGQPDLILLDIGMPGLDGFPPTRNGCNFSVLLPRQHATANVAARLPAATARLITPLEVLPFIRLTVSLVAPIIQAFV
jgi:DNA-binding NarL/FixJ family response regulator